MRKRLPPVSRLGPEQRRTSVVVVGRNGRKIGMVWSEERRCWELGEVADPEQYGTRKKRWLDVVLAGNPSLCV